MLEALLGDFSSPPKKLGFLTDVYKQTSKIYTTMYMDLPSKHVISLNIPSIHLMLHEAHVFFLCFLGVVSGRRFPKTWDDFRMLQRGFELLTILESYR